MDIDFVITWVDGNDPEWQKEKDRYLTPDADNRARRFREWGNLQYLLRGMETFAPWVHKVFLVTCGHYPKWLNLDAPKLRLIRHDEYIPKEWLPTFSSRCIDTNFHRIRELSECFVYFNDDTFLTAPTKPEVFFKKGLPRDAAVMSVDSGAHVNPNEKYWLAPLLGVEPMNRHFNKRKIKNRYVRKCRY